jgi:hypothetical protein
MGQTRRYATRVNLAAMTPRADLSSTAYVLASPGSEYLVYQPQSGPFAVDLIAGTYDCEWFDAVSGTPVANGVVTIKQGRSSFTRHLLVMQSSILRAINLSRFFSFHETKENQNTVFNRDIFRRDNSLLSSRRSDEVFLKTLTSSAIVMMVIPHANQSPKRT